MFVAAMNGEVRKPIKRFPQYNVVSGVGWIFGCVMIFIFAFISENPWDWLLTGLVGFIFFKSTFKPGGYPIEFLAFLIPFVEISFSLLEVELSGISLEDGYDGRAEFSYRISMVAFVVFMLFYRFFSRKQGANDDSSPGESFLARVSMMQLIQVHLILLISSLVLNETISNGSSFGQLAVHVQKIPLAVLFLIAWKYLRERTHLVAVILVFVLNIGLRLGSFFSDWSDILLLLVFTVFTHMKVLNLRATRRLSLVAVVGVASLITWQAVKAEYREYLNQGSQSQRVEVGWSDALSRFYNLTVAYWAKGSTQEDDLITATIDRIGYIDFFALAADRVPSQLPHEGGSLLLNNLEFALVPRVLNPEKGTKDDQWKVEYYANVPIADHASFSLGRYAEWYIDFGPIGMLFMAAFAGAVGARLIRLLRRKRRWSFSPVDAFFSFLVLRDFASYQSDEITIYGWTFWAMVVYLSVGRTVVHRVLFGPANSPLNPVHAGVSAP